MSVYLITGMNVALFLAYSPKRRHSFQVFPSIPSATKALKCFYLSLFSKEIPLNKWTNLKSFISRFGFEGLIWVLIASVPDLCIHFNFCNTC